jgi:hypothetical protein
MQKSLIITCFLALLLLAACALQPQSDGTYGLVDLDGTVLQDDIDLDRLAELALLASKDRQDNEKGIAAAEAMFGKDLSAVAPTLDTLVAIVDALKAYRALTSPPGNRAVLDPDVAKIVEGYLSECR